MTIQYTPEQIRETEIDELADHLLGLQQRTQAALEAAWHAVHQLEAVRRFLPSVSNSEWESADDDLLASIKGDLSAVDGRFDEKALSLELRDAVASMATHLMAAKVLATSLAGGAR